MNSPAPKNQGWLYGLAFLIAVAFRFIQLGAAPLTDSEATLALQAFQLARGETVLLAPQPLYILFTSLLFVVIEATNFMARFLPAIAGSALVFVPYLFRGKLGGDRPALILALLIAFDPGLTALSRQANGTILALTFLLFAWGMWLHRRELATGIFLALALLSGPSFWAGVLTLFLAAIFLRGMITSQPAADPSKNEKTDSSTSNSPILRSPVSNSLFANINPRSIFFAFLVTLFLAGTLFFTVPNGLSAAFAALPAYLNGWVTSSAHTTSRVLFAFFAYELFGILIALFSLLRGFRTNSKRIIRLNMWLGLALLLAVFYRDTDALAWAIIPLLALAAMELSRALDLYREELAEVGMVVAGVFLLLIYLWFNLSGIALNPIETPATVPFFGTVERPRLFVFYGSLGILLVSLGLVAFGWSARVARLGATWSIALFFGLYSMGAAWGASGLRNPGGVELWLPDARPVQAALLRASVEDLSKISLGHINAQPVTIHDIQSPALEWLLRNNPVTVVTSLDPLGTPPILITPLTPDPGLPAAYRGQDFIWRQNPRWAEASGSDWVNWFVFRKLPLENETVLLWARNDLFPDGRGNQP
jgi:hypothetical protein